MSFKFNWCFTARSYSFFRIIKLDTNSVALLNADETLTTVRLGPRIRALDLKKHDIPGQILAKVIDPSGSQRGSLSPDFVENVPGLDRVFDR